MKDAIIIGIVVLVGTFGLILGAALLTSACIKHFNEQIERVYENNI